MPGAGEEGDWQKRTLTLMESRKWSYIMMALIIVNGLLIILIPYVEFILNKATMGLIPILEEEDLMWANMTILNATTQNTTMSTGVLEDVLTDDDGVPKSTLSFIPKIYKTVLAVFLLQEVTFRMYLFRHVYGSMWEMFYIQEDEGNVGYKPVPVDEGRDAEEPPAPPAENTEKLEPVEEEDRPPKKVNKLNVIDAVATWADIVVLAVAVYLTFLEVLAGRFNLLRLIKPTYNACQSAKETIIAAKPRAVAAAKGGAAAAKGAKERAAHMREERYKQKAKDKDHTTGQSNVI
mmetsp:Transcript_63601/g.143471  ORF Transcript_63601/g.143471 Transcript_63601/m.143471 type:complete len:292 (-) Transcript_63601:374-1249(-)|eukprot:CAMPEP_0172620576 /NCGR_PEP_ID=MMETSP1068-20121228/104355_1 /TAXON_ID=35684 /ORGANISM="Pseudopedinella elastica, Strain CCMP716" /LENGTH=291 /DNA_ID=CAMNT_0013427887 /DNA_START=26 /DNA_END=901 /DNA_ORIENTATION=+